MDNSSSELTCYKCGKVLKDTDLVVAYVDDKVENERKTVWFHTECFSRYEHYHGLDKPID